MPPPQPAVSVWLLTAPHRRAILRRAQRSLAASDLPPPHIFTDPGGPPLPPDQRIVRAFRAMLTAALHHSRAPWLLCLEDDIAVHPRIWAHLHDWLPFRRGRIHTFATLYNPSLPAAPGTRPARHWLRAHPRFLYGAQALLIARPFALHALQHWDSAAGMQSRRLAALSARNFPHAPLYVHRPSLVQHCATVSTWGLALHTAPDFPVSGPKEA